MANFSIAASIDSGANILLGAPGAPVQPKTDDPVKIRDAARQFEALLLEQVMQSAKGSSGWLRSDGDSSEDCATGLAEQQLAMAMAQNGGLGLSGLIAKALEEQR